ncbi:MAG: hypothetical protein ONB30_04940 [candidate division KSB1 bacterium]|nr:hypothetical protein [candidate division KSB1 bacterium]
MKRTVLLLVGLMIIWSSPAACQKTRVLLRRPIIHGHITPQQADSLGEELRHRLLQTGIVELVSPTPEAAPAHGFPHAPSTQPEPVPMADEIVDARLHKSGEIFALTLTALETVEHVTYTSHGEARSLAALCATLVPEFVEELQERHRPDRMVIRVERGFDIFPMDKYFGISDPFVEVWVDSVLIGATEVRQDERDPVWEQSFLLPAGPPRHITLVVYDKDALDHRELIGKVTVPWGRDGIYAIRRPQYVRDFGKVQVSFGR